MNEGISSATDIAIFYRTNAQSRVLEEQLRYALAFLISSLAARSSTSAWRSKTFSRYMKLIINPTDDISA